MEARPLNSLIQHRADGKAKSLSTSTIRPGTEVAYCPMGVAPIYICKSFPLTARGCAERKQAGSEENILRWASVLTQQGQKYLSARESQHGRTRRQMKADDEIVGLFM